MAHIGGFDCNGYAVGFAYKKMYNQDTTYGTAVLLARRLGLNSMTITRTQYAVDQKYRCIQAEVKNKKKILQRRSQIPEMPLDQHHV